MAAILDVQNLSAGYGRMGLVLDGISLSVPEGQIVALLGANGAGKTTLIRAIAGLMSLHGGRLAEGRVMVAGEDASRLPADRIVRLGVAHVPEGRRVFRTLSVADNLAVGAAVLPRNRRNERMDAIYDLFPRLAERRSQPAGLLSGGEQQMLAVGRALAAAPRLMLIDELSLGLAPLIVRAIYERLRQILTSFGTSMLVVEQNARLALQYCDQAYVLEGGRIALFGAADALKTDPRMQDLYLGASAH